MTKATLKRWQRDALETMHKFKHDMDDKAVLAKAHAKRVVVLTDKLILEREDAGGK